MSPGAVKRRERWNDETESSRRLWPARHLPAPALAPFAAAGIAAARQRWAAGCESPGHSPVHRSGHDRLGRAGSSCPDRFTLRRYCPDPTGAGGCRDLRQSDPRLDRHQRAPRRSHPPLPPARPDLSQDPDAGRADRANRRRRDPDGNLLFRVRRSNRRQPDPDDRRAGGDVDH